MFAAIFTPSVFVLGLVLHVSAHAAIAPALGISGTPARSDVQRPSANAECGNINIASNFDSSHASVAAANGTFATTIINFNGGEDGSREIAKLLIDPTGTGKNFTLQANLTQNGDGNPNATGSQQLLATLPRGIDCTGGKTKDLCLASFVTTAGFGNCVVIRQAASSVATTSDTETASTPTSSSSAVKEKTCKNKSKNKRKLGGPLVARAMRDAETWGYELH